MPGIQTYRRAGDEPGDARCEQRNQQGQAAAAEKRRQRFANAVEPRTGLPLQAGQLKPGDFKFSFDIAAPLLPVVDHAAQFLYRRRRQGLLIDAVRRPQSVFGYPQPIFQAGDFATQAFDLARFFG